MKSLEEQDFPCIVWRQWVNQAPRNTTKLLKNFVLLLKETKKRQSKTSALQWKRLLQYLKTKEDLSKEKSIGSLMGNPSQFNLSFVLMTRTEGLLKAITLRIKSKRPDFKFKS